ncbi:MAG: competence/damage-inducible protein A [Phycisphaerae bacterium]
MACYPILRMDAVILSIGNELTTGQAVDTNAAWLSAALTRFGISVVQHVTVDDDLDRICAAIRQALGGSDIVIITGGLGPTPDDLTRQAFADAVGEPLEQNAEALEHIRTMFARWQRPMSESNKVQALIPRGCEVIPNERGTAPGIRYRRGDVQLFALPGVPAEMQAMFNATIASALEAQTGGARTHQARLLCYGISEAKVGEVIGDLMKRDRNPLVGTTALGGVISVRVVARGNDENDAKRLVAADLSEIRRRLGTVVFGEGDDSLEAVVARLLTQQGQTIATAESCTGGLLAKRLTDVPGSSAYFLRGYVTYSNEAKTELVNVASELIAVEGAVSEPVARAMASGCRTAAGSDFALSITGIAGPTGGSPPDKPVGLVYIGLADSDGVEVKRFLFGEHLARDEIRDRSCKMALNLLRIRITRTDTP